MTAITQRLLHCRRVLRPRLYTFCHFSSVPPSDIPPPKSESESESAPKPSFSSYFNDVRATLQRQSPSQNRPQPFRKNSPQTPPPSNSASLEQIHRNLAEFRSRSAPPPPPSASGQYVSLQELYKRNVITRGDESENSSMNSAVKPPAGRSFGDMKESLVNLRGKLNNDQMSLSRFRESLESPRTIGGSGDLPSFLLQEKKSSGVDSGGGNPAMKTALMRMYNYSDLGTKLKMLRPEKKKGKWFSLQELNERLAKLREMEEKESEGRIAGVSFRDFKDTIEQITHAENEKKRNKTMQRLDILNQLGGTPSYLLSDPKNHLVEKYFHPDNLSSAEKLKLELKKVRDEFKMSESDCGSARVQVAQLTTKIKHLSTVLQKKDKHSRRGLVAMVQRRKKLLKYLRRTDWDSYCLVLSKLGLRDSPDIKS